MNQEDQILQALQNLKYKDKESCLTFLSQIFNFNIHKNRNMLVGDAYKDAYMFYATLDNIDGDDKKLWFTFVSTDSHAKSHIVKQTKEINQERKHHNIIMFLSDSALTITFVTRRTNKKDSRQDVLEKIILIKNINLSDPHPAHVENLKSIKSIEPQEIKSYYTNILNALSIETLNTRFYTDIKKWFDQACVDKNVKFPHNEKDNKIENHIVRLITRIIFIWFIKQKDLVPQWIFNEKELKDILHDFGNEDSNTYYNAILQNLFFATLNQKIKLRKFATDKDWHGSKKDYNVNNLYRDNIKSSYFKISTDEIVKRFEKVPFLNGGLFECLDIKDEKIYIDGFSRERSRVAILPDSLFFGEDGLYKILSSYHFTIDEATSESYEIALDPELLGRIFENLLAHINEDTGKSARKSSGSFYTPREIVSYMVKSSIFNYCKHYCKRHYQDIKSDYIHKLIFSHDASDLLDDDKIFIKDALIRLKVLDPACGSGAFPMDVLHELCDLHRLLDEKWSDEKDAYNLKKEILENNIYGVDIQPIAAQISKLRFFISLICDATPNENLEKNYGLEALPNLECKFVIANSLIPLESDEQSLFSNDNKKELDSIRDEYFNADTYEKKKKIKEKYKAKKAELSGIDNIAQHETTLKEKQSELKDLEKKIKAEKTIIQKVNSTNLFDEIIKTTIRQKSPLQLQINKLKADISKLENNINRAEYKVLKYDPFDSLSVSPFFDASFMFGVDAFDIVIGNPPYGAKYPESNKNIFKDIYKTSKTTKYQKGSLDTFAIFIEMGFKNINKNGFLTFIIPMSFTSSESMTSLHNLLFANCENISISSYGYRPNKIFFSAETNVSILSFTKTMTPTKKLLTTTINKRYKNTSINQLLNNLSFVDSLNFVKKGRIPKISTQIEIDILSKIYNINTTIKDILKDDGDPIYYRTSGGLYYKLITNFATYSSKEQALMIDEKYRNSLGAIMSSNFYYWFWLIHSNWLDMRSFEIMDFPIPINKLDINKLDKLYDEYIKDIKIHAKPYRSLGELGYYLRKSKHIIDKIDLAIAKSYNFTEQEIDFIINFDKDFRLDN